ncbi:MAG TPA: hypothetical protein VKH43_01930 [Thermoanaerobaculia bacterium]|nr:hypothetical protein [Thermoanaerobaculia bacterium]
MVKRFSFLAALLVAAPLRAGQATQKYDWSPVQGAQDVHVEVDRIVVSSIQFDLGSQVPPTQFSTAKAVARVDNNGFLSYEVGVAVVVFDEDGHMVAAGSGGVKLGSLGKGERDTFTIKFPSVYRNFDKAKTFLVTLETQEKGAKPKTP